MRNREARQLARGETIRPIATTMGYSKFARRQTHVVAYIGGPASSRRRACSSRRGRSSGLERNRGAGQMRPCGACNGCDGQKRAAGGDRRLGEGEEIIVEGSAATG